MQRAMGRDQGACGRGKQDLAELEPMATIVSGGDDEIREEARGVGWDVEEGARGYAVAGGNGGSDSMATASYSSLDAVNGMVVSLLEEKI